MNMADNNLHEKEFESLVEKETLTLEYELSPISASAPETSNGGEKQQNNNTHHKRIMGFRSGVSTSTSTSRNTSTGDNWNRRRNSPAGKYLILISIISLLVGLSIIRLCQSEEKKEEELLMKSVIDDHDSLNDNDDDHGDDHDNDNADGIGANNSTSLDENNAQNELILTCPESIKKADNDHNEILVEFYNKYNEQKEKNTMKGKIDVKKLKSTVHDGWGHNYNQFKKILKDWKVESFSSLKSGDKIFESGCGIGLNLLMTVEILKESTHPIDNLQVYGIEYVEQSMKDANYILGQLLPQTGNAQLGSPICQGDATDLYFIPSNSFDLAYTGYIDPIVDPLNLGKDLGRDVEWEDLCKKHGKPTKKGKLDQQAVEDWYAKWVTELVRITKPGKPVVIEQVSIPTCRNEKDWGGVSKWWWKTAVEEYKWDVDVDSIIMKDLSSKSENRNKRYNVYMEKNR